MAEKFVRRRWTAVAINPPALSSRQWMLGGLVGIVLFIMAISQILTVSDFEANFSLQGLSASRAAAFLIIVGELWAAAGLFKIKLSRLFRNFANGSALLVGLFWFTWNAYLAVSPFKFSTNFFGGYTHQVPGIWSLLESLLLVGALIYLQSAIAHRSDAELPVVTRINKKDANKGRR